MCDPAVGKLDSADAPNAETCETLCQYSHDQIGIHPFGCQFFTYWSRAGVKDDCYLLNECSSVEHAPGADSGLVDCQDQALKCPGGGEVPPFNDKVLY